MSDLCINFLIKTSTKTKLFNYIMFKCCLHFHMQNSKYVITTFLFQGVDMEMSSEPEDIQERKSTPEQPPSHAIPQQQITQPRPPIAQPIPPVLSKPQPQTFRGPSQNVRADVSSPYPGNSWSNSHQYAVRHQYRDVR